MNNLNHSRTLAARLFAVALLLVGTRTALAAVRYVDVNSTNATPPYTSWVTAATNIQDAVDAAVAGDEIVVTNGIYATGERVIVVSVVPLDNTINRVAVDKSVSLRSVNGPQSTTIDGGRLVRCVYLTNGARLSGFTLTNGGAYFYGGAVFCESTNALVSNCVLTGNSANSGGGAYGCTLNNCSLTGNSASGYFSAYGGGAYNSTLNNCTLSGNRASHVSTRGGNGEGSGGGAASCMLNNCTLIGNSAVGQSGCNGGFGGGAYDCGLNNCTITGNSAVGECFNSYGGGVSGCTLYNCIVYFNTAHVGANFDLPSFLSYCCTTPNPGGPWNITNAPVFADRSSGNLRLQSNSPCINAGLNALAPVGPDLDGNPRIAGGTVDMGAYEFQAPASMISYAWLQQYALPIDGSSDTADSDGDGLTNWQEWRCRTDPTNALSALRLLAPVIGGTNATVTWQSVAGLNYFLERGTNLAASPAFTPLATNLAGQSTTTTYMDTNAVGSGPFFYRVGVQ